MIKKILYIILLISIILKPIGGYPGYETTNVTTTNVVTPIGIVGDIPTTVTTFRVGPTVRIRPLTDIISKDQDGLVELYMDNPSMNSVLLTVDFRIITPSRIDVYGQGFGKAGAGMVYGKFEIPPGAARTINIIIKTEKIGDFSAQFSGTYYPDDNKDAYQPISLTHPFKVIIPTLTVIHTPISIYTPARTIQTDDSETHVSLYGEKTDVIINEDILLRLSAVNTINKPVMTVQVILYPPSGMSVTGQEFAKSGAGIYTTTYKLDPSDSKDIEIKIRPNQIGDFNVKGVIVYYFGDDKSSAETITKILPIKVNRNKDDIENMRTRYIPGFEIIVSMIILLIIRFFKNNK